MTEMLGDHERLANLMAAHGSPVNLLHAEAMGHNANELAAAAEHAGIPLQIYFARKANKAILFVEEARKLGLGVDVASENELTQVLAAGLPPERVVLTAAVKPAALLRIAVEAGVTIVVDNTDEFHQLVAMASAVRAGRVPIGFRLRPDPGPDGHVSRFGMPGDEIVRLAKTANSLSGGALFEVAGLHFHLDGYLVDNRVAALGRCFDLVLEMRESGMDPRFIDIGGGIPMSYLDDENQWNAFWTAHEAALNGDGDELTYRRHGLGLPPGATGGSFTGQPNVYPAFQRPIRGEWMNQLLGTRTEAHGVVGETLRNLGIELRCEPGRSLLDGCGMTAARVAFVKAAGEGTSYIGLEMNRTQCRSAADEFMVDPLLVPDPDGNGNADDAEPRPTEGYLVGAYCIERELLSWRRMRFPQGVEAGDIIVFPNTAGYLMHILESASHQIPLAGNVNVAGPEGPVLDAIDSGS